MEQEIARSQEEPEHAISNTAKFLGLCSALLAYSSKLDMNLANKYFI